MKKLLFLPFLAVAVFSCKDDDSPAATVNLNLKATFDGEPLIFVEQAYEYPDGKQVKFQMLNFFISDVALLEETGTGEVEFTEVEFVDFSENYTLADAQEPVTFKNAKIPPGNYKGIRIGIGVPARQNKSSANQLSSDHPLRKNYNTHFWTDWDSFIFLKSEGIYDNNGDGFGQGDSGFGHHPGSDATYRTLTFLKPIVLKENETLDLNVALDILKMYVKNGQALDLTNSANLDTQNPNDLSLATYLMDNLQSAFSIE